MGASQSIRARFYSNAGYVGFTLALFVAVVHLFHPTHGFPKLLVLLGTGDVSLLLADPRPALFVLSAFGILLGVQFAVADVARNYVYVLGMVLAATYFVGYFAWHLTGHGGFLPGREPLYHGLTPVQAVVTHLASSPLAALAKLSEVALFAVLNVLYRQETAPAGDEAGPSLSD